MSTNEWTRDDLPSAGGLAHTYAATSGDIIERFEAIVDELVWRLNANHPKLGPARWRRAHSIVEAERDTARRERDEWKARAEAALGEA